MPDKREHRGAHPQDHLLFGPAAWPRLRESVGDLSWLLSRGYAEKSALKLVGDRYSFEERQRMAVMRCACSDSSLERRRSHQVTQHSKLRGHPMMLDGYNVLTTVEAALAGGVILLGRDGCYRDIASMHGTFRRVEETIPAMTLIGEFLAAQGVSECGWYLDSPVSNSGRLKGMLAQTAAARCWSWKVELAPSPDPILSRAEELVATADSVILDRCQQWFNLTREIVIPSAPEIYLVDLSY